jgi:RHS repeat-associated protein
LVTEVKKNNQTLVKFYYNDRNHRVKKENYTNHGGNLLFTEHYVRDVAGQVMAIYKGNGAQELTEQPIYGSGRIGVSYVNGSNRLAVYELTDHLGNVRATFTKNGAENNEGEGFTDYYPFGMPMPGRSLLDAEGYRYAFQGQEKDPETGKEAFELRLWDSRIGRWLTTDPYREFSSPYLGMGNNPISRIDPDGGCTFCGALQNLAQSNQFNTLVSAAVVFNGLGITDQTFEDFYKTTINLYEFIGTPSLGTRSEYNLGSFTFDSQGSLSLTGKGFGPRGSTPRRTVNGGDAKFAEVFGGGEVNIVNNQFQLRVFGFAFKNNNPGTSTNGQLNIKLADDPFPKRASTQTIFLAPKSPQLHSPAIVNIGEATIILPPNSDEILRLTLDLGVSAHNPQAPGGEIIVDGEFDILKVIKNQTD